MKHWTPRIAAAIDEIVDSGADRMIAIVLAPHFSKISTGGYRRQIEAALAVPSDGSTPVSLDFVESWHELDGFVQAGGRGRREGPAGLPQSRGGGGGFPWRRAAG